MKRLCLFIILMLCVSITSAVVHAEEAYYLGTYTDGQGRARDVEILDNVMYVCDDYDGLELVDISDINNPVLLDKYSEQGTYGYNCVVLKNQGPAKDRIYCYYVDYSHFHIFDVTNQTLSLVGSYIGGGTWSDLCVLGEYVYVAGNPNGLTIFDISNPASPQVVGTWSDGGSPNGLDVISDGSRVLAYIADDSDVLDIVDVTDPYNVQKIADYDNGGYAERIVVYDNIIYLAEEDNGLRILQLDESDPLNPHVVELGAYTDQTLALSINVQGKYAYLGCREGLKILNITDPANLVLEYHFPTAYPTAFVCSIALDGSNIYLADYNGGVDILDISEFVTIASIIDFNPNTLNLNSNGNYVTAYITLPVAYDVADIDVEQIQIVKINATMADPIIDIDLSAPISIGDYDEDDIEDLMVKFDRQSLIDQLAIPEGQKFGYADITVRGFLYDGTPFQGTDEIRVKASKK